ncbi:MAG: hypothetical protein AABW73_01855 [Nanoarchaeota archaeon]
MEEKNTKKLIQEFFKEAVIKEEKELITISEVKPEFEEFIGKKSPYKLVFDIETHNKIRDSELIMQGSYFLQAIRDYLNDKGETSKQKILIKPEINEIKIPKGYKVEEIKEEGLQYFAELTFLTTYQYLNEKKQIIRKTITKGKEILEIKTEDYKTQEGINQELENTGLDEEYKTAKNKLKTQINSETKQIRSHLREKLEKELERIRTHYHKQIKEKDEELERCEEKIKKLKSKLKHTYYDRDIRILTMLIKESIERLENLKKKSYKERLIAEEKFHLVDAIEKHVLSIKNSLMNITIFYYQTYELTIKKEGKTKKIIYDPILKKQE